jgi:hypothetical protein
MQHSGDCLHCTYILRSRFVGWCYVQQIARMEQMAASHVLPALAFVQVGTSTFLAKAVAEACRLEKFEAIRAAAKLLEELQPATGIAGATQPADLAAAAGGEEHIAAGSAATEILLPELLAALSEQPGDLPPMPAPLPQPFLLTPEALVGAGSTPFGTAGAADVMAAFMVAGGSAADAAPSYQHACPGLGGDLEDGRRTRQRR